MGWLLKRIVPAVALFAMAVLTAAVPVHHTHMLRASLAQPVEAGEGAADHYAHHDARHHAEGAAEHARSGQRPDADHENHDMPPCPVCSSVQAAAASLPSGGTVLVLPRIHTAVSPRLDPAAIPPSFHFRPVQPRAPPTAS